MIAGEHSVIRTSDSDDAYALSQLYAFQRPRAALLDRKRELVAPTARELQEVLGQREQSHGIFHTVEDKEGVVRGFCMLRGVSQDAFYGEIVVLMLDDADYAAPLPDEALAFLCERAFVERKLIKVVIHCLDTEEALEGFVRRSGFEYNGTQREVFFSGGRYHGLKTYSLYRESRQEMAHAVQE